MPSLREQLDGVISKEFYSQLPKDYWRVSSIGMPFDAYHRRLGTATDPIDDYDLSRSQMLMKMGTLVHELIQEETKKCEKVKILGMEDTVSSDEYNVKGHYDIYVEIDGKKILYDIKTVNSFAYSHMKKEGGGVIKPYDHHVKQLLAYDYIMGQEADELRLFYVGRNEGRREEIPVERNPEMLAEVLAEWDMLNECWETKTPPNPPEPDTFQYKYSNYKSKMHI